MVKGNGGNNRIFDAVMISKWKTAFLENSSAAFEKEQDKSSGADTEKLYARISRLELEKEFLKKA